METHPFNESALDILKKLSQDSAWGNRWFKVNLHVHGQGSKPQDIVSTARAAEIDLLAITDHQTFRFCDPIIDAARTQRGRPLAVLPGMEITAHEGIHLLAVFPISFTRDRRERFLGWLELPGGGETAEASKRVVTEVFDKVESEGGVIIIPHPFAEKTGLLDSARKMNTKVAWLEGGHVNLMQVDEQKVTYVARDASENWVNRFVLASARPADIDTSTYCLAPFNRSDAHDAVEIGDGCSWFKMSEPTVAGLQQVACEPFSRISRVPAAVSSHSHLFGMRVSGGYCDGQFFRFNSGLNCIIGQNYSGKSAVLDLLRFGLGTEATLPEESQKRLHDRLSGILGIGNCVEVFLRASDTYYAARRAFDVPELSDEESIQFPDSPTVFSLSADATELVPCDDLHFPVEVYEQGRISRLRDDLDRQLQMLDEFADTSDLIATRTSFIQQLHANAETLAPLQQELTELNLAVARLSELKTELKSKQTLLPSADETKWSNSATHVSEFAATSSSIEGAIKALQAIPADRISEPETDLQAIFGIPSIVIDAENVMHADLLQKWAGAMEATRVQIAPAKQALLQTLRDLQTKSNEYQKQWNALKSSRDTQLAQRLAKAGVDSPQGLLRTVQRLTSGIADIERKKKPRLEVVTKKVTSLRDGRTGLLEKLDASQQAITKRRAAKAADLTRTLGQQIRVTLHEGRSTVQYQEALNHLCDSAGEFARKVVRRELQIAAIMSKVGPRDLAYYLTHHAMVTHDDGTTKPLDEYCGVTANTIDALVAVANRIDLLDELQTVVCEDTLDIQVRRKGEAAFAELTAGLSPGEQSSAILTLALQTRSLPLILDQPEDELGYSYVVHLIVPKILDVKASRQMIMVTHNANIPVLGDADNVIQMENRPRANDGRSCVIATCGCFESDKVTEALVELEGGKQAFQFRKHRYTLPHHSGMKVVVQGEVR